MTMNRQEQFLSAGSSALANRAAALTDLSGKLHRLSGLADARTADRARGMREQIAAFSAKVTLIGQVKAGKSALTSILAGVPGLLPSDVNPWTSVVTTLVLNPPVTGPDQDVKARFTFFDRKEWDHLVVGGGRLGELAERTGAGEERDDIRRQVNAMREAAERRLGRQFELLLGQTHSYGYVDSALIERYVCLSDDPGQPAANPKAGRFADVTRSAEIRLKVPAYPLSITLCDTPGVNDTFMVREQITIQNLHGSEVCVVVLSAHQALTTADMALMRIISSLDNGQTIIFVNRIDELSDPVTQVGEIRASISRTLQQSRIGNEVSIVFGSAKWAEAGMGGKMEVLSPDSLNCLNSYAAAEPGLRGLPADEIAWRASGVPALLHQVGERISEGSAKRLDAQIRRSTLTLTNELRAALSVGRGSGAGAGKTGPEAIDPVRAIAEIAGSHGRKCEEFLARLSAEFHERLTNSQATFVKRATDALVDFLQRNGEKGTWSYDAAGFRALQRAAYTSFARSIHTTGGKMLDEAAQAVQSIYLSVLGPDVADFVISAPLPPQAPPPVGLGKTIALDLQQSWWRAWWRNRRSVEESAQSYVHLIKAEVQSISDDLEISNAQPAVEALRKTMQDFLTEQQESIRQLMAARSRPAERGSRSGGQSENHEDRFTSLVTLLGDLEATAA